MHTGLKIDNFWDKWSDEEQEAVIEFVNNFAMAASQEAARIALEKFKSALDNSEENVTTDSE